MVLMGTFLVRFSVCMLLPLNDSLCAQLLGSKSDILYSSISSCFNVISRATLISLPLIVQICSNDGKVMLAAMSGMIVFNLILTQGLRGPRVKTAGID
jgi:hypothetical protein